MPIYLLVQRRSCWNGLPLNYCHSPFLQTWWLRTLAINMSVVWGVFVGTVQGLPSPLASFLECKRYLSQHLPFLITANNDTKGWNNTNCLTFAPNLQKVTMVAKLEYCFLHCYQKTTLCNPFSCAWINRVQKVKCLSHNAYAHHSIFVPIPNRTLGTSVFVLFENHVILLLPPISRVEHTQHFSCMIFRTTTPLLYVTLTFYVSVY